MRPIGSVVAASLLLVASCASAAIVPTWHLLAPNDSTDAGSRAGHVCVYDAPRDRMVAYGALAAPEDLWMLSLRPDAVWKRVVMNGPRPPLRTLTSAVLDSARGRVLLFGGGVGESGTVYRNDVWALSLADPPTWTPLTPSGSPPDPLQAHAAVFDAARRRMLVFGGMSSTDSFHVTIENRVWELDCGDTLRWRLLAVSGIAPAPRFGASMVLDAARGRAIVFGGYDYNSNTYMNDLWALSLADPPAWTQLAAAGAPPAGRYMHAAILDAARHRMIVTGGKAYNQERPGDTWALSLGGTPTWSLLQPGSMPTEVFLTAMIVDPVADRIVRYGGSGGRLYSDRPNPDLYALDLASGGPWTAIAPLGSPAAPSPRVAANLLVDTFHDRVIVQDGYGLSVAEPGPDHWSLPLGAPLQPWTRQAVTTPPGWWLGSYPVVVDPPRRRQIKVQAASQMLQMSLDAPGTWQVLATSGTPPPGRTGLDVVYDAARDRLLMSGGWLNDPRGHSRHYYGDVWALSLAGTPTWTQLRPDSGYWVFPSGGTLFDPGRRMLFKLGSEYVSPSERVGLHQFPVDSIGAPWTFVVPAPDSLPWSSLAAEPTKGRFASLDLDSRRAFVFTLDDTAGWVTLDVSDGAPSRRYLQAMTWDGPRDRLLVFGGQRITGDGLTADVDAEMWALTLDDAVPVEASLVSADASLEGVRLRWWTPDHDVVFTLERAVDDGTWTDLAVLSADGGGTMAFFDRAVAPGRRHGYRLAWSDGSRSAEAWITVPTAARLALAGARPNPSDGRATIAFALSNEAPATLELLDLGGRRVLAREVGALGAGEHVLALSPQRAVAPGVYFVRLRQGAEQRTSRMVVCR